MNRSPKRERLPAAPSSLYLRIYGELKKEIADLVRDARATERNTLLSCGALWAFIFGAGQHVGIDYLKYVPLALALFGGWRVAALMLGVRPRAQYLSRLEERVLVNKPLPGWENFFRSHYRRGLGMTQFFFWIALIGAMAFLAFGKLP